MPLTNEYITPEGLDFLALNATSLRRTSEKALRLDDRSTPLANWMHQNHRALPSVNGGYRMEVKGNRDQREEAWDGADRLTFQNHITPFSLEYYVGKTHFGNTEQYDFIERNLGVPVKYGSAPGDRGSKKAAEVVLNYLDECYDDIKEQRRRDRARRLISSNSDSPKHYSGLDALLPADTNSTGTIGGADRSNKLLQHILVPGVSPANYHLTFSKVNRELNRYAAGSRMRFNVAGDNFYDMLVSIHQPNANGVYNGSALPVGWNIDMQRDKAQAWAAEFRIGLPMEAFMDAGGNIITNDQVLNDLDEMYNPSIKFADRMYCLSEHTRLYVEKDGEYYNHGMARDQVVCHESWFSTLALTVKAPRSNAVLIRATS